jgi:nucleotide-binding universal stress UspA family protein
MKPIKTILVPTDFSENADKAVATAFELARQLGAKVHIVHAYGLPPLPDAMGMSVGMDLVGPLEDAAGKELKQLAGRYDQTAEFGRAELQMAEPRDLIVRKAKELPADLIVMGTHGRRGFQHLILGSVAESTVRHAPCPVLVVPPSSTQAQHRA